MFEIANEFFMSLGLSNMSMSYGPKAQLIRPTDREVVCHARFESNHKNSIKMHITAYFPDLEHVNNTVRGTFQTKKTSGLKCALKSIKKTSLPSTTNWGTFSTI